MIDLHAHVLPGIDDGPSDEAASLAMLRQSRALGTRVQAATPHLRSDHPGARPEELGPRCRDLKGALGETDLRLVPGAEVDLLWAAEASSDALALASYGRRPRC